MSNNAKTLYAIVRSMTKHPNTKFLAAPISETYYLENKELGYFITLSEYSIRITNHTFFATESFVRSDGKRIVSFVKNHIESIRKEMESEIFDNQSNLYKTILNNLKQSIQQ
jgi:hypothetical protein